METTFCITETVLSRGELAEILRRARHHVIEKAKYDSANRFRINCDIELHRDKWGGVIRNFSKDTQLKALWYVRIRSPCYSTVVS